MSVQAIANIVPFTPGGAGAQQALLAATLTGPSRTAVLAFSVGTQIAMAAWSVVLGFAAILLVFRTTDWRGLIREAQDEADQEGKKAERTAPEPEPRVEPPIAADQRVGRAHDGQGPPAADARHIRGLRIG